MCFLEPNRANGIFVAAIVELQKYSSNSCQVSLTVIWCLTFRDILRERPAASKQDSCGHLLTKWNKIVNARGKNRERKWVFFVFSIDSVHFHSLTVLPKSIAYFCPALCNSWSSLLPYDKIFNFLISNDVFNFLIRILSMLWGIHHHRGSFKIIVMVRAHQQMRFKYKFSFQ